jgi:hypothetical protein
MAANRLFITILPGAALGEASGGAGNCLLQLVLGERFDNNVVAAYF